MSHDNFEDGSMTHPGVSLYGINLSKASKQTSNKETTDESTCSNRSSPDSLPPSSPQPSPSNPSESPSNLPTNIPDDSTHIIVPVNNLINVISQNLGICTICSSEKLTIKTQKTIHLAYGLSLYCSVCHNRHHNMRLKVRRLTVKLSKIAPMAKNRIERRSVTDKIRYYQKK